jgi:hypothetical protein
MRRALGAQLIHDMFDQAVRDGLIRREILRNARFSQVFRYSASWCRIAGVHPETRANLSRLTLPSVIDGESGQLATGGARSSTEGGSLQSMARAGLLAMIVSLKYQRPPPTTTGHANCGRRDHQRRRRTSASSGPDALEVPRQDRRRRQSPLERGAAAHHVGAAWAHRCNLLFTIASAVALE